MNYIKMPSIIVCFFLFICTIADFSFPFFNHENYFSTNFGLKELNGQIKNHKYTFLYNDCTDEYLIQAGSIGEMKTYLCLHKDLYGGVWGLQESIVEDATRFKDTTKAKRWLLVYKYYEHRRDSIRNSEASKWFEDFKKEESEKIKNIDTCKDIFKPLTK